MTTSDATRHVTDDTASSHHRALADGPRWWLIAIVFGAVLTLAHAASLGGDIPMVLLSVVAPLSILVGVRAYRPEPAWPWCVLVAAGTCWSVAGAVREFLGTTGDPTADRSLTPDVFAVVGYGLFAAALLGMLRAQGQRARSRSLLLDGAMLATSAGLLAWVLLIAPVLHHADASMRAKVAIVMYPPISALLVSIAARLAFASGAHDVAHRLLLGVMVALLIGDVAYVPLELNAVGGAWAPLLQVPYAIAYVLVMATALHPSMRDVARPPSTAERPATSRFVLLAIALITPGMLLLAWEPASLTEKFAVGGLVLALETTAVARVVFASREQATVEARLARRASHDELTGLFNRAAIRDVVTRTVEDAGAMRQTIAILFIDLDRFKLINDSYGHVVGDELILAAAERLKATVTPKHTVARLSGDEFLVVARDIPQHEAVHLAATLCDAFTRPFELIGSAYVTASVGIVVASPATDPVDATSLIRDADTAMYEAKRAGRSSYRVFDPAMRTETERQLDIHTGLRDAIENNGFEVYYQIVVDPYLDRVAGVEALVRWQAEDGRVIPPDQFIEVAEDTGVVSAIGEIVLRDACAQVARWRHLAGCEHLTLAVNLSARQLLDADMVAVVADVLDDTGFPADSLWLEITESVMMTDTIETLATLSGLRELGVHLSVDDFGTGYSSLTYLQRYPIEQLKIDRSFVHGLCERTEDQAVVTAIVGIARALRLSIVAEGVEQAGQATRLKDLGCELAQGYLFGRPAPAIEVGPMLIERNHVDGSPHRRRP